jgi:hypothetical protein
MVEFDETVTGEIKVVWECYAALVGVKGGI